MQLYIKQFVDVIKSCHVCRPFQLRSGTTLTGSCSYRATQYFLIVINATNNLSYTHLRCDFSSATKHLPKAWLSVVLKTLSFVVFNEWIVHSIKKDVATSERSGSTPNPIRKSACCQKTVQVLFTSWRKGVVWITMLITLSSKQVVIADLSGPIMESHSAVIIRNINNGALFHASPNTFLCIFKLPYKLACNVVLNQFHEYHAVFQKFWKIPYCCHNPKNFYAKMTNVLFKLNVSNRQNARETG